MNNFVGALIPILALICLGYGLKLIRFIPDEAWRGLEKLTYFILFPSLLIRSLAVQNFTEVPWLSILVVSAGVLLSSAFFLVLIYRFRPFVSGPTFTSIFQGGVRYNTYIVLAVAQGLHGAAGLAMGSVAAGFIIGIVNLLCISAFVVWGEKEISGVKAISREIFTNPLILGCLVGTALSLSSVGLPGVAEDVLEIVGRAALPFGLLAVGAALKPEKIRGHLKAVLVASVAQFGLKSMAATLLVSLTGLTGVAAAVMIISFMVPTAPSGYILARQLGGDTETMASIITCQTLLAFVLMPFLAMILL